VGLGLVLHVEVRNTFGFVSAGGQISILDTFQMTRATVKAKISSRLYATLYGDKDYDKFLSWLFENFKFDYEHKKAPDDRQAGL
jgi:hypothetical protein